MRGSDAVIYGGFSAAIVIKGVTSPLIGRLIDRHGGRRIMAAGSILTALACMGLALSESEALYYGAWLCLGAAMRLTLYDAAFASLARVGGVTARQAIARLCEVVFGRNTEPLALNLAATSLIPLSLLAGFLGTPLLVSGIALCFLYGAGNGLTTITHGTLPLVFFKPGSYGGIVGWLLVPSFLLAAAAPLVYVLVMTRFGAQSALYLSLALALVALAAASALHHLFRSDSVISMQSPQRQPP